MKKTICLILILSMVSACGGRPANPVMIDQYGDHKKSCRALELEMANTQEEVQQLIPQTEKTGKNVALGIAGAFILVPWFFMDLTQSEQIEVNALRERYNHLAVIAEDKNCGFEATPIPAFTKPKEEEPKEDQWPSSKH